MKLRLLPPLWIVWVPLFSPGALPQPAVVAAAAEVTVVPTYAPTATSTMTAMITPSQGADIPARHDLMEPDIDRFGVMLILPGLDARPPRAPTNSHIDRHHR